MPALLAEEIAVVAHGLTYRGVPITIDRLTAFLLQFPIELHAPVAGILRAMFSSYYWSEIRFHSEVVRLVSGSGILPNQAVAFGKWQELGDSAEAIAAEFKKSSRWRNSEIDLREGAVLPATAPPYLVIVDDIVGSGGTVRSLLNKSRLTEFSERFPKTKISFIFLAAWSGGLGVLREYVRQRSLQMSLHVGQVLSAVDSCFDVASRVLVTPAEREAVQGFCKKFGKDHNVGAKAHLGFGNCALAFSFHAWIPNNSLPFLWHDMSTWRPLLPRSQQQALVSLSRPG